MPISIDLQNLCSAGIEYISNSSNSIPSRCNDAAASQLKGIKPILFEDRKLADSDTDFAADVVFGFCDGINSTEFRDATAVLPPKQLNLCFQLYAGSIHVRNEHPPSRFKEMVIFKQLLDSDLAFQALRLRNPGNGNIEGF
jgi:hypothetical protein